MLYYDQNGNEVAISRDDERWLDASYFSMRQAKLPADAPRAAAAYRVSTKNQVDHDDIPMQRIACRKFAQTHGWRVVTEKLERGVSGSKVSIAKRDKIQELKAAAEHKEIDILLLYMFDRLGRIESETPFVIEWFIEQGVQVWSTHEGQRKIENHNDKLINYLSGWMSSGESEKISMRTRDRLRQLISGGHYTGGTVPYGYRATYQGRKNKRDIPVKDLEIDPDEAAWVREVFERVAYEGTSGYALAQELTARGIRTRTGAIFRANNVLRIIRHAGYTGYLQTKEAKSDFIPTLKIVEEELFVMANDVIDCRSTKLKESKNIAHDSENPTLLAGLVYCAHCGAKMSGFLHNDRYKLKDGTVRMRQNAKYNCYQKGQKLRDCDGQQLYIAEKVDEIVLAVTRKILAGIKDKPYTAGIERQLKQASAEQHAKLTAAAQRVKELENALESYEGEILKCIEGTSAFSQEVLAKMIGKTEEELRHAKENYDALKENATDEKEVLKKIQHAYDEFKGWAEEFDAAPLARKRMILNSLYNKIELGRGYAVRLHLNMSFAQFVELTEQENVEDDECRMIGA